MTNVHFVGDALISKGYYSESGAQGTYVAENLLKQNKNEHRNFTKFYEYRTIKSTRVPTQPFI